MFLLLIFINSFVAISLAPELMENKLNASLCINFKYNGNLNHNLDQVWIVTKKNYQNPVIFTCQVYNMTAIAASYKRLIVTQQVMREKKFNKLHGFMYFTSSLYRFNKEKGEAL